jgi:hypothetical protein
MGEARADRDGVGLLGEPLAILPNATFGDGLRIREGAEHYVQIGIELLAVYRGLGYTPQNFYAPVSKLKECDTLSFEDAVEHVIELGERFIREKRKARTSMHEDVLHRRKTEVDFIFKPFLEKARVLASPKSCGRRANAAHFMRTRWLTRPCFTRRTARERREGPSVGSMR